MQAGEEVVFPAPRWPHSVKILPYDVIPSVAHPGVADSVVRVNSVCAKRASRGS